MIFQIKDFNNLSDWLWKHYKEMINILFCSYKEKFWILSSKSGWMSGQGIGLEKGIIHVRGFESHSRFWRSFFEDFLFFEDLFWRFFFLWRSLLKISFLWRSLLKIFFFEDLYWRFFFFEDLFWRFFVFEDFFWRFFFLCRSILKIMLKIFFQKTNFLQQKVVKTAIFSFLFWNKK